MVLRESNHVQFRSRLSLLFIDGPGEFDIRSCLRIMTLFGYSPSGWDSENKIAILYENIKSANPDDSFSEVIMKPLIRKVSLGIGL